MLKPKLFVLILLLALGINCYGQQDTVKINLPAAPADTLKRTTNPIIFAEAQFGYAAGSIQGLDIGFGINYQFKKNLFTLRYNNVADLHIKSHPLYFLLPFPLVEDKGNLVETSLLYGLRFVKNGTSFSFSAGISYNDWTRKYLDAQKNSYKVHQYYAGVPFELNVLWFKSSKERFRILFGLIPVGKPTGFGRSVGFKLHGNISKHGYAGLGIIYGLGLHKQY